MLIIVVFRIFNTMNNNDLSILSKEELIHINLEQSAQIQLLQHQLAELKRLVFGQKRERFIPAQSGQASLFDMDELKNEREEQTLEISYKRSKTKKQAPHSRNPLPANLPRKEIIIEPEGIDLDKMKKIGEEVTEELEYEEAKLYVNKYIRPKYVPIVKDDFSTQSVVIADMPERIIPKGIAGAGLISHIIISKFIDHLPVYRIRRQLKRLGVDIAESTINDWLKQVFILLEPLYNLTKEKVLSQNYLMVDETTIKVLDKKIKGKTFTGYFWVYYDPVKKRLFFEYRPGRHKVFPNETLSSFSGALQSDGYTGYNEVNSRDDIIGLACFAHARRKFEHALKNDRKRAGWMLKRIQYLYKVERIAKENGLTHRERYEFRQRHSLRILNRMHEWLLENRALVLPKSEIGIATGYSLNLWKRLIRYVEDGRYEIDNNLVENSIRPVAIGRKNYLFAGSHNGAEWAAVFYTITANARLKGLEPKAYFKELLEKIPGYSIKRLKELLPENRQFPLKDTNAA